MFVDSDDIRKRSIKVTAEKLRNEIERAADEGKNNISFSESTYCIFKEIEEELLTSGYSISTKEPESMTDCENIIVIHW